MIGLAACALASCDKNPVTIASIDLKSPDGGWIALARTEQYSGPGNAGLYESVWLERTAGKRDAIEVLLLDEENPPPVDVKLQWLTPSHLEIAYREPATVDFHLIKYASIDISLRVLESGK